MKERRSNRRLTLDLQCTYSKSDSPAGRTATTVVNMSSGGLCFTSTSTFKRYEKINFQISLKGKECINITARIAWSRPFQENKNNFFYGVNVLKKDTKDLEKFIRYCEENLLYPPDEY